MKQRLSKPVVFPSKRPRQSTRHGGKELTKAFTNTKCPYCDSYLAYFYWLKFDTAGYCPECNVNWVETENGTVWKLPINVGRSCQATVQGHKTKDRKEVVLN